MSLIAFVTPGGSPGATTTALVTSGVMDEAVVVAECNPEGSTVVPGVFAARRADPKKTILELARDIDDADVRDYLVRLNTGLSWYLLAGLIDPRDRPQLDGLWSEIGHKLADCGLTVFADCGTIGGRDAPYGLLAAAHLVVMVLRPTRRQVHAARCRLEMLRSGIDPDLALCLVGEGRYAERTIRRNLFDLPVLARFPHDPQIAAVWSDGAEPPLGRGGDRLAGAAADLADQLSDRTAAAARKRRAG